ncbi:MAG: hydroxymethylglutaryl-CoA lyase [Bacteroidia bacterium]
MQGLHRQIPTAKKVAYLDSLLRVGFDTLDFGSFVSPRAVPQMADTADVLAALDLSQTRTRLLAIVANAQGAKDACRHAAIRYLGYPFSISETFQMRNTRRSVADSLVLVEELLELCQTHEKELVVYLSMAFGNPYGDPWTPDLVAHWTAQMAQRGVHTLALADTVGTADPETIGQLFHTLIPQFDSLTLGAHLHARPEDSQAKLVAAWEAGCRRFDVAMLGYGGCPFAKDELVGNIATGHLLDFLQQRQTPHSLDMEALAAASMQAAQIFE